MRLAREGNPQLFQVRHEVVRIAINRALDFLPRDVRTRLPEAAKVDARSQDDCQDQQELGEELELDEPRLDRLTDPEHQGDHDHDADEDKPLLGLRGVVACCVKSLACLDRLWAGSTSRIECRADSLSSLGKLLFKGLDYAPEKQEENINGTDDERRGDYPEATAEPTEY